VRLNAASVPAEYYLLTTPQPRAVNLKPGEAYRAADLGVKGLTAALGDAIWYDADHDGLQEVGEAGIGNVTVDLWLDNGDGVFKPSGGLDMDTLVGSGVSDANGAYRLDAPAVGDYFVYFVDVTDRYGILGGLEHTLGPQSVAEPSPKVTVGEGQVVRGVDFGYVRTPGAGQGVIGDRVWLDGNGNRVWDEGEAALLDVEVCATPVGGGASVCERTDLNGRYSLVVAAGTYRVGPTSDPFGLTPTAAAKATVDMTVAAGEQQLDVDFGYHGTAQATSGVGGVVWHDKPVNDVVDGVYNPASEPGIGNVSVDLIVDANDDGVWDDGEPIVATQSNSYGDYLFTQLLPGPYLVRVSDTLLVLRNFAPTILGPAPLAAGNNHAQPHHAHLAAGVVDMTVDFGYREYEAAGQAPPEPGVIGNQVWLDVNGDGVYTAGQGDQALSGVTVRLDYNGAPLANTTTGLDGRYLFTGLTPGETYVVRVTDSFGVLAGYQVSRLGPQPGQDDNNQAQPYSVTLSSFMPEDYSADFAYVAPAQLGGMTWIDTDGDGAYDAGVELPLSGAGIEVRDSANAVVALVLTGPAGGFGPGQYQVGNLPPGTYSVKVAATPTGFAVAGASSQPVILASGQSDLGVDFAFSSTTSVAVASFSAQQRGQAMVLRWETAVERGNAGFHVQRAAQVDGPYEQLTTEPVPSQALGGAGASYRWEDTTAQPGAAYWYRLVSAPEGVVIGPVAAEQVGGRVYLPVLLRDW
jgi:hypothetical protein